MGYSQSNTKVHVQLGFSLVLITINWKWFWQSHRCYNVWKRAEEVFLTEYWKVHWEAAKQGRLIFTRHEYLSLSLHSRNSDFALGLWLFLLTFFFNNQKRLIAWKMTLSGYNAQVLALDISNPLVGEGVLKSLSVMYCFSHPFLKHLILAGIKMLKTR